MRPTFLGFETAKSSIFTNQKAIDIVGNNLANIDTNGYTRQRVDTASQAANTYASRVANSKVGLAGQGVEALGVSQMRDSFLDKQFREQYAKASYHGKAAEILGDINNALGDGFDITDEGGLFSAVQQIYTSIIDYANDPTQEAQGNIVLSAFRNAVQVLQQMNSKLDTVAKNQTEELGLDVDRVNDIFAQVADLNRRIAEDAAARATTNEHYKSNELMDQRNLLLDELASYGDINVKESADGMVTVEMGGHKAVDGFSHNGIIMHQNEDDHTVGISWVSTGQPVSITGGTMQASVEFINGRGNNVQSNNESPKQGILYYRDRLDTFANALAQVANSTIPELDPATGKPKVDADGKTVYKTLLAAKGDDGKADSVYGITASNLAISDKWNQAGAGYFIYSKDENMPNYAQDLAYQMVNKEFTFQSYGESFSGTFEDYERDMLSKLGSDKAFQQGRQEAVAQVADDFLSRRDEVSGVSRDEETANMLMYQKSYEAAARVMTTLDDLLDVVINRMGRAGL